MPPFRTVISPAALAPGKRQGGASGSAGVAAGYATVPHRDLTGGSRAGEAAGGRVAVVCATVPHRDLTGGPIWGSGVSPLPAAPGAPSVAPPFRTVISPAGPLGEAASRRFRQSRGRHRLRRRSAL